LNQEFTINGQRRDTIGIGMSIDKMILFNLSDKNLVGIVCSDNYDSPLLEKFNAYQAQC